MSGERSYYYYSCFTDDCLSLSVGGRDLSLGRSKASCQKPFAGRMYSREAADTSSPRCLPRCFLRTLIFLLSAIDMLPRVLAQRAPCPDYPLVDGKWALRKHWVGREKTQCSCPAGLTINVTYPVPQDSPHPDVVLPAKKCHIAMRALAGLAVHST